MEHIGKIIKQEREKFGISRRAFAITCGISPSYLGEIERGEKSNPSSQTIRKIVNGFNKHNSKNNVAQRIASSF